MPRFTAGLMSVTFRSLPLHDVATLAARAGLGKVSWSGDVHVQPGNFRQAALAAALCAGAGLDVESYGSYWRADGAPFGDIAATAARLGAPRIRVWAGASGSAGSSADHRARIAGNIARAADLAAGEGITLHLEFHPNTLTDTAESTVRLLADIAAARDNPSLPVRSYWQPRPGIDGPLALAELRQLGGTVGALHVFSWDARANRLPLKVHAGAWRERLETLAQGSAGSIDLMLEFVAGDSPDQLLRDASELHSWIEGLRARPE
ncbi:MULTISPECIES: sugar phosphate isomerase/epimerase [unclassified Arthrobacter]|uniref:sugar phosphate isomerase/epimerase family protein n=1 Tax=unclassified Arthrobacter TaxID=235627 RepID=UPI00159D110A|nr:MULTISPECIES: TIM barrel protein [unclassified Arthrobacter]MCQ9162882.1 TIM barrel protein [Arthrobacter sp. STN4]NVM98807.1 TIM barrel protein [Arthrobacter sp. SDTb3-6]